MADQVDDDDTKANARRQLSVRLSADVVDATHAAVIHLQRSVKYDLTLREYVEQALINLNRLTADSHGPIEEAPAPLKRGRRP